MLRFRGSPKNWRQRLMVATRTGGDHGVVSHRAAAALHGVDGWRPGIVEVTVPRNSRVRHLDVRQHRTSRLDAVDIVIIDGLRCTTLERTMVDLAAVVGGRQLERALDDYERRVPSLDALEACARRLHRPGQRGTKRVLREIDARRHRGMVRGSWFERLVEACLQSPLIPELVTQYELHTADGAFIGRFDLAIPAGRLLIEAHSRQFHTGDRQQRIDQRRDNLAALEGWDVRYIGWADKADPASVRRFIERIVARRLADLGLTHPTGEVGRDVPESA